MDTVSAINGTEAVEALENDPLPHLVLLDLMLPEISGIEFLKQMRSQSRYNDVPVIILSALTEPEQIREGLSEGADRYLTKPYLANNLVKTVREVIEHGRRQ
jgi:DNA-binding response OmpR family regulator